MTDHLVGRDVPIPDKDEANQRFDTLATTFEARWLTLREGNPVEELWARKDYVASIELAWLGDAIQRMSAVDEQWTKREAKKMKTGHPTNRSGALFEVLALSLFCEQGQTVKPMPKGNPGYDGIVQAEGQLPVHLQSRTTAQASMRSTCARRQPSLRPRWSGFSNGRERPAGAFVF